jgi:hypothetical protein
MPQDAILRREPKIMVVRPPPARVHKEVDNRSGGFSFYLVCITLRRGLVTEAEID